MVKKTKMENILLKTINEMKQDIDMNGPLQKILKSQRTERVSLIKKM
jgi:hypothetical protein